ncbi:MAG: FAD-binding oxidoreductase [Acidobacteria bacterium]|nr:FAD-binding oxidoreductase [Acidobacteriota bacterium]
MTLAAPSTLAARLAQVVGSERVSTRPFDLLAWANDASVYHLVPQAVVHAATVEEIRALFRASHESRVPLTFRAAGTSLSGQAVTDGVLVECARHWRRVDIEDEGRRVRVQPGAIGGHVNRRLAPFGTRLGPDPASINACTIGGILANNSSGMCCGVAQNAYQTLVSLTIVLPSGTVLDTGADDADARLHALEPALASGLLALKAQIEASTALAARIRTKYRMKNTNGYSLNAFVDFDRAIDILAHLMVGSEGTLGFIAEAVLRTVPDLPVRHTGLLLFESLHAACAPIGPLERAGARALELMDRAALRSVDRQPGAPALLRTLPDGAAGLLVEFQAADEGRRPALRQLAADATGALSLVAGPLWTDDAGEQARLWRIRQGMFPSVGAARRAGTAVIIEDVAFPVPALADAAVDLTRLFAVHGYDDAIIFGHAKDGNLHFVLTPSFDDRASIDRYARFLEATTRLVVEKYDGALKGEHGTGRNMAPFVEAEWGPDGVEIMRRVKALADPAGLLNPGIILNDDDRAHVAHLKTLPPVAPEVDTCIECGYCEPHCPSRDLTLTPRQRIVVKRAMARLERTTGDDEALRRLRDDFDYAGLETCAADGMCATACPVGIDTGQLVKRLRGERHSDVARWLADVAAGRLWEVEQLVRAGLRAGHTASRVIGTRGVAALTRSLGRVTGAGFPEWTGDMPRAARRLPTTDRVGAVAIYLPSCLTRVFAPVDLDGPSVAESLVAVAARAGRPVHVPHDVAGACCGVPFSSKGFAGAHEATVNRTIERLWAWSDRGRLPVVVDTSPCTYGLQTCRPALTPENQRRFDDLQVLDAVTFACDECLPRLTIRRREPHVAAHPVCSLVKMQLLPQLVAVTSACAEQTTVPASTGCCGFAGDRGFLHPELTASATRDEAIEIVAAGPTACVSTSRTCEIGLSRATGHPFGSVISLLDRATTP